MDILETEFLKYCYKSRHVDIKRLLDAGVNVDTRQCDIKPYAYSERHDMKYEFESGCVIYGNSNHGMTALMIASWNRDTALISLLLEYNANVNIVDRCGNTALIYANTIESIQLLIDAGSDINHRNERGYTTLTGKYCMFASNKHIEICTLLLENGANPDVRNLDGRNQLFLQGGGRKLFDLFIEYGAHINARDNNGKTPLDIQYHPGIQGLLYEHGAVFSKDLACIPINLADDGFY